MERELALRKMDKNRAEMESVLRFALETLVSGKKRIGGKSASKEMMTFDKEIRELQAKLEEIRSDSRPRSRIHSRSAGNFNQRALLLRRRLKKMEETTVREIHEVAEYSDVVSASKEKENLPVFADVEMLRRKMEGLSRGMREMMEEHKLLFLPSNPAAVSCGGRHQMIGCAAVGVGKNQRVRLRQAAETFHAEEEMFSNSFDGCCNCKNFLVKIIEQVGFETEQWGEMQAMLDKVKADMDELCSSRDHWENRALSLELSMRSFYTQMVEWKRRAHDSEQAATELRDRIARISAAESSPAPTLSDQLQAEISRLRQLKLGERTQASPEYHGEMAKETVIPRYMNSKKSCVVEFPPRRASLREIGNLSHSDSAARLFR
ncbi:hypothetical protein HPP92_007908 [Vanilla planifolia]|uniref:Uncharacterized protein n=1 Tax=Vanilla planifolia TaxID=51239 RepID=A0A835V888_VANPL|nr:hypothetical protein HPP92_007908 [Vanilla planifolia]